MKVAFCCLSCFHLTLHMNHPGPVTVEAKYNFQHKALSIWADGDLIPECRSPGHVQQAFTLKFNGDDRRDVEQSGFKQAQSKQGMCLNLADLTGWKRNSFWLVLNTSIGFSELKKNPPWQFNIYSASNVTFSAYRTGNFFLTHCGILQMITLKCAS